VFFTLCLERDREKEEEEEKEVCVNESQNNDMKQLHNFRAGQFS
jgi:hypothetical protein